MDPILEEDEGGATLQLPRLDYKITVGALIQMVVLITGLIVLGVHQSDQLGVVTGQVHDLQASIAALPTQTAEINQLQAHATQTDSAISLINSQIRDILSDTIKNTADIENIKEASQTHLRK